MGMKYFKHALLASVVTLGGCATTLEHRTPIDIASNSVQIHYPDAGVSEILAPPVKAFRELRSKVAGMAQLRTAGPFTDKAGTIYENGAYLDILINYTSASPDPLETRQYSQARWPDGEIAQLADFGASVLDCRADIRNVRRFPFGNGYYGTGYYGYSPYGYGYGNGSYSRRHLDRRVDHVDHVDHNDANDHTDHNYNHTDHTTHDRNRRHRDSTASPARPAHTLSPQPSGHDREPDRGRYFNPGSHPYSGSARTRQTRQPHTLTREPSTMQAPQHRTNRPKRNDASSRPHKTPSSNRGQSSSSGHSSSSKHKFSRNHRSGRHLNYYPTDPFYNPGYVDTVVRRYCARQENLRVFIPRERLDAAKISGISLLIRPRGGREEVLNLPPNYIAGFMLAAWTPEGRRMTIPGYPAPRPAPKQKPALETLQETNAPLPNPQTPDPKKPIIYGEN